MDANHPNRSFRLCLAVGAGVSVGSFVCLPVAHAQYEPAARLLPARPLDEPASTPKVTRAASPEYSYDVPSSVPAPNYGSRPTRSMPTNPTSQSENSKGVFGGAVNGVKEFFGVKPSDPKPVTTTPQQQPPQQAVRAVQQVTPPPQQPQVPPPGLYAGPPAYRWYGYGSPTPGSNPYAPAGLYPKGSANWYTQTKATPGAFPVPVSGGAMPYSVEPPTYVGTPPPAEGLYLPGTRVTSTETSAPPSDMHSRRNDPQMPTGSGTPIVASAMPAADPLSDVGWQPASLRGTQPIASSSHATPPSLPPPVAEPTWAPAPVRATPHYGSPPPPSVSMIRGQAPADEPADVTASIRSACFGRATGVAVSTTGPNKLHVRLVAPTESDARDAAAVVSRLPALKAYTVTFEATVNR